MSQSGYSNIQIYASGTTGHTPSASNLNNTTSGSELAINYYDGLLFYKDASGNVQTLASKTATAGTFTGIVQAPSYVASETITGSLSAGAFSYGTLSYSDVNIFASFTSSVNTYNQMVLQNTNTGASASSDFVVSNNNGTASTYYGDYGINSSGWTGTAGANSFNAPNMVYLTSTSTDLLIGTTTSNVIRFATNGGADSGTVGTTGTLTWNHPIVSSTIGSASGSSLSLQANGTTYATILGAGTNNGYFGINTTSPAYQLDLSGVSRLGNGVSQASPSSSNILSTAHTILNGTGGNYLTFGQDSSYNQWIQSSYQTPSTAVYNLVLQPLGGNLGLGVTPNAWGSGQTAFEMRGGACGFSSDGTSIRVESNAYYNGSNWIYKNTGASTFYSQGGGVHYWYNAPSGTAGGAVTFTQVMTLDANGNLGVGGTSGGDRIFDYGNFGSSGTGYGIGVRSTSANASSAYFVQFVTSAASSPTQAGSISWNGVLMSYGTGSDRRLKSNIVPLTNSGAVIDALLPRTYTWNSTNTTGSGFIADEIQTVLPSVVTGNANAVDKEGNPLYQMIDLSTPDLIANIVAELQSLRARLKAANIA
jgi:hypothetical protein